MGEMLSHKIAQPGRRAARARARAVSGARREEWGAGWEASDVRRRIIAEGQRARRHSAWCGAEFREAHQQRVCCCGLVGRLPGSEAAVLLVVAALLAVAVASSSRVASYLSVVADALGEPR